MKVFHSVVLLFFLSSNLLASHLSSASIRYECLGSENYQYEIVIYRDCNSGSAQFNNPLQVGIYLGYDVFDVLNVVMTSQEDVQIESYTDCDLNSFNYCLQKATYIFEINLPTQSEKYVVFHSRCCFSETIGYLIDPAMNGLAFLSELSPLAQLECNSQESYSFSLSRPFCANAPFELDLPLFDSEGDSLSYSMCMPFKGGGSAGVGSGGDPTACNGIAPNLYNCPPTYEPIELLPSYSAENPFPTLDGFNLNNETGSLSFVPTIQGTFIFGICVDEFRDGTLLSSQIVNLAKMDQILSSSAEFIYDEQIHLTSVTQSNIEFQFSQQIDENMKVRIVDIHGKELNFEENISRNQVNIRLREITSGMYFVRFLGSNVDSNFKIFIPS